MRHSVAAILPALDEEAGLTQVLAALPRDRLSRVVVVDNGSTDGTAAVALRGGAEVVAEPRRGYGSACLAGLAHLRTTPPEPDTVVFLDADGSDDPLDLPAILDPIASGRADLVVGSRTLGRAERGALAAHQKFGNALATHLIRLRFGVVFTDLGPFRAVRWVALERLEMRDPDYGWTAEMQVKAARAGLRCLEVPVRYRKRRLGRSKISGTFTGSWRAGVRILRIVLDL